MFAFSLQTNKPLIASLISGVKAYFTNFAFLDYFLTGLDIFIVAAIIYLAFVFIKGTRATRIIYGAIFLGLILILGRLLELKTLNWALKHVTTFVIVAIPIVFQPELRRALEKLGRTRFFAATLDKKQLERVINELIKAVKVLKKNKVGALIVIRRKTGLDEYIETGAKIDARLTSELLLNLFYPGSPLHDGAVIIKDGRIAAAGCMLPLSEGEYSYTHGTRHRAAIGITEETDAVALVLSEEKGTLSISRNGKLTEGLSVEELEEKLTNLLREM
jgi:diadenylate cyclase